MGWLWTRPLASRLFGLYLLAAGPLIVLHLGRFHWFFRDEWAFLADRDLGSISDIFRPHNEHWDSVGVIVFRTLYAVFGLRTYIPYQAASVMFHGLVVVAIFLIMRRSQVRPGIAAISAGSVVLFGPGSQNFLSGFQVAFTGAVGFSLVQMLLLDHDGPWRRRDTAGVACGAVALMCSGIALPMTVGVGAYALVRRNTFIALGHTVPLAAIYGIWFAIYSPNTEVDFFGRPSLDTLGSWVWDGEVGGFVALSYTPQLAVPLIVMTIAGALLALIGRAGELPRRALLVPAILAAVAVLNLALVAQGRWAIGDPRAGRYLYITAVLTLPFIAVALEACARFWRPMVVAVGLLVLAMPANASNFTSPPFDENFHESQERLIRSIPLHPRADDVPAEHAPFGLAVSPHLTVGYILDAHAAGDLNAAATLRPADENYLTLLLAMRVSASLEQPVECRDEASPYRFLAQSGESIALVGNARFQFDATESAGPAKAVNANSLAPTSVEFLLDDVPLRIEALGAEVVTICRPAE